MGEGIFGNFIRNFYTLEVMPRPMAKMRGKEGHTSGLPPPIAIRALSWKSTTSV